MKRILLILFVAVVALQLGCSGCGKKQPPVSAGEVKALAQSQTPTTLEDPAWNVAPVHPAKLILQDIVEPRLMTPSTQQVNVQAVSDGRTIAFLLRWDDATLNDKPGAAHFTDACAVQLPQKIEADVPAPQMGEDGRPVEITYWSANWQSVVNGRADDIKAIYPNATVDHYPFQAPSLKEGSEDQQAMAKRYAPARAMENPMSGPRKEPVQDLIAEGPGTIRPSDKTLSTGVGKRTQTGWSVLIVRPLPQGASVGTKGQIAFAVWNGANQEVGARKMRTPWIPFAMEGSK